MGDSACQTAFFLPKHEAYSRSGLGKLFDNLTRPIGAGIVDDYDFPAAVPV